MDLNLLALFRTEELDTGSLRKTSETDNKANIDDMFNLTKAIMKKNRVILDPINSESFSMRESVDTNRKLIKKKT